MLTVPALNHPSVRIDFRVDNFDFQGLLADFSLLSGVRRISVNQYKFQGAVLLVFDNLVLPAVESMLDDLGNFLLVMGCFDEFYRSLRQKFCKCVS